MKKEEYIKRLANALAGCDCDADEAQSAIEYYTELLEEAQNADEQMKSLGSPEELARQINPQSESNQSSKKKKEFSVGRVLALVFTSWLWLTIYSLLLCLFCIIVAVYAAFPFMAIASFVVLPSYTSYLPNVIELFALAVISIGISVMLFQPMVFLLIKVKDLTLSFTRFLFTRPRKKVSKKKYKLLSKAPAIVSVGMLVVGAMLSVITVFLHPNSTDFAKSIGFENVSYDLTEDTTSIRISAEAFASVKILPSDTGSSYITVENVDPENLSVIEGDNFTLNYKNDDSYNFNVRIFNISNPIADITLYLSEDTLESLDVDVSCGDLRIEDVCIEQAALETEVGEIEVIDASFFELGINNDCGGFDAENLIVSNALVGTLDVGSATLQNVTAGAVVFDVACGSFDFDGEILGTQTSEITTDVGDISMRLKNGESYSIFAETDVGSVSINGESPSKSGLDGSTIVQVYADCGDIDIETD